MNLFDRLEKTANEAEAVRQYGLGEDVRDHAQFGAGLGAGLNGAILGTMGAASGARHGVGTAIGRGLGGAALGAGVGALSGGIGGAASGIQTAIGKGIPGVDRSEGESNLRADARGGAVGGGILGALSGGMQTRSIPGALGGGTAGALSGGLFGAGAGGLRDAREEYALNGEEEEQVASDLMYSLDKIAERQYGLGEDVRDHAQFGAGLGAGVNGAVGALSGGAAGAAAGGPGGALIGAVGGGVLGAGVGALSGGAGGAIAGLQTAGGKYIPGMNREEGESNLRADTRSGAAGGAILGGLMAGASGRSVPSAIGGAIGSGLAGGAFGAGAGYMRDRREARAEEEEQVASELFEALDKTASNALAARANNAVLDLAGKDKKKLSAGAIGAIAGGATAAAGATGAAIAHSKKKTEEEEQTASELFSALEKTAAGAIKNLLPALGKKNDLVAPAANQAKKRISPLAASAGIVGGAAAIGGATGAVVAQNKDKEEKTASEDFMNEMIKEAATSIIQDAIPETKAYKDPMDGIKFRR